MKIKFKAMKVDPVSALIHPSFKPRMQQKGPPKRHERATGKKRVKSDLNQEKKEKEVKNEKNERKEIRINKRQRKQHKISNLRKSLKRRNLRTMHRYLDRLPKLRRKLKRSRQGYLMLLPQLTLKMRITIKLKGSNLMEIIRSH